MIMFKLKQFRKVTSTIIKMQIYSGGFFFCFPGFSLSFVLHKNGESASND